MVGYEETQHVLRLALLNSGETDLSGRLQPAEATSPPGGLLPLRTSDLLAVIERQRQEVRWARLWRGLWGFGTLIPPLPLVPVLRGRLWPGCCIGGDARSDRERWRQPSSGGGRRGAACKHPSACNHAA